MNRFAHKLLFVLFLACPLALAQQPINVLNIGGTAASTGNGTTNSGDLRVNIASDNTAFQVELLGHAGAAFDAAQNAAAPANGVVQSGVYNSSLPSITSGNASQIQLDSKGQQLFDLNYVAGAAIATGNGTNGGAIRVAIASDNTAFAVNATLQAGSATVGKVDVLGNAGATMDVAIGGATAATDALQVAGVYNSSAPTLSNGQGAAFQLDSSGNLKVNCTGCSAASTVSLVPATSGGLSLSHTVLAASTNATSLKASAGQVYEACVNSNAAYPIFLKLYNKASSPTVGTDTPVKIVEAQAGVPACMRTEEGFTFGTGIAWAVTKGIADSDSTAVLASDGTVEVASK
jgi:hypothetical protein